MRFNGDREQGKEKESEKTTFTNVFKMPCYEGAHTHQIKEHLSYGHLYGKMTIDQNQMHGQPWIMLEK